MSGGTRDCIADMEARIAQRASRSQGFGRYEVTGWERLTGKRAS